MRPRQLLVASFAEGDAARAALNARFGFDARPARVRLERFYDRVEGGVLVDGRAVLDLSALAPLPLAASDLQFFSSLHPAETPKGLRLVQIDAEAAVSRAERGGPHLEHFDPAAFGLPDGARLGWPVAACVALCDLTLQRIRFVCRADVPAFAGTERIG